MQATSRLLVATLFLSILLPLSAQEDPAAAYVTSRKVPVLALEVKESFDRLTEKEKLYAHWMSQASWLGNLITFAQVSVESPEILELLLRLHAPGPMALRRVATRMGVTDEDLRNLRMYAAQFLSNAGNYLSFGDTRFIPRIPPEKLELIVLAVADLGENRDSELLDLFDRVRRVMYSVAKDERELGIGSAGRSAYYSESMTQKEVDGVNALMVEQSVSPYNTRVAKVKGGFMIETASVARRSGVQRVFDTPVGRVAFDYGLYSEHLVRVVGAFRNALPYVANDNQREMVLDYIRHFESGDIDDHKNAMRHWVLDKGPVIETNIGFIESYRDPAGVRGEWEGLVAIVNKEQSRKFNALVQAAPKFIPRLPWGKGFEKDTFKSPDFTSLEVLTFASSGIPAGINIPNYDDIRQNEGFKNVSLGNVLSAKRPSAKKVALISDADQELYKTLSDHAFEVQVGLHELLGHGSGKLLREDAEGKRNFDPSLVDPVAGKPVASCYKPGQTWGSVFSTIASSYEECRAEGVGLYLSTDDEILKVFGFEGEEAESITYVNWLIMARGGLAALRFYNPETKKWGQAHMQARFALMQVMLRAGGGLLTIKEVDGKPILELDREKVRTVGRAAVGEFLTLLNVYKATANEGAARKLYADFTSVTPDFVKMRGALLKKRSTRSVWVQPVTDINTQGQVILRTHAATPQGVIDSYLDRFGFLFGMDN